MGLSILYVCMILFFSFASAMFSGASIALWSISRDSLQKLIENRINGASKLYRIVRNKNRFQLMLVSGRVLSIIGGVFCAAALAASMFQLVPLGRYVFFAIVVFVTSLIFIITENIIARLISLGDVDDIVPRFSFFLVVFYILLYPLTYILSMIHAVFIKEDQELAAKEDALLELVKSESEAGVIEQEERQMIQGVLDFFDTTVREVMQPRIDMVAIEKGATIDELIALFKDEGHSRIPVYDERVDNILGVVYAKDLLTGIAENGIESIALQDIMRKAYFVHESKKIPELLAEFRTDKVHLAVVVDEYGGTAGIVALEDLLEEIVGDIRDEYDDEERDYFWVSDTAVIMDAGLDIGDVNEIIHSDIPDEDFDTLGGFVYQSLGVIPKGGEQFESDGIRFTVKKIDGNRISKVLVLLSEPLMKDEDDAE